MCHYHDGYHMTWASEIDAETGPREPREELSYDLPWRFVALFFSAVMGVGASLTLVIDLLS